MVWARSAGNVVTVKLFKARIHDVHQGWLWLANKKIPARGIVKVTSTANGNSFYCEALQIDKNFLREYNEPPRTKIESPGETVVVSAWFRQKLGDPPTGQLIQLKIESADNWRGKIRACLDHPQVIVRVAAWLGLLGMFLGLLGVSPLLLDAMKLLARFF